MNKQHPCCTVFLSTRTPQEALKCRCGYPKGCAAGIFVKTASYRPPDTFFWVTPYVGTPQARALHGLYASSECFGAQKGGRNKQHSKLYRHGLPTGARRRYLMSRHRSHVDNSPKGVMKCIIRGSVDR